MRRTLHDTGAHEEARLLEPQQESIGLRTAVDQIVVGPHAQEYTALIIDEGRIIDGGRIEIEPRIIHRRSAHEILDIVLARALQLIALPHLDQIVDAVDADQRLYLAADCGVGVPRISALEGRASSERGERGEVRAGGCAEQADALRIDSERASAAADELH